MCFRYVGVDQELARRQERLRSALRKGVKLPELGDLFPGEEGVILRPAEEGKELVTAKWGLTPHWAKDAHFGKKNAYNARGETLAEKPTFRDAYRHRRCIVPATALYEQDEGRWLRLTPKEGEWLAIAGLWEPAKEVSGADTYTMVTTDSNELVLRANDRMPVILPEDAIDFWMAEDAPSEGLRSLIAACPSDWLTMADDGPVGRPRKAEPNLFEGG